jgi:transcriptional antiterminator RfaH
MSKPNKEEALYQQLHSRGYEVFYPKFLAGGNKPRRLTVRSYFPGYLFLRVDLNKNSLSAFQWMPNSEGLVCFGTKPAYVPDILVEAIKRHVAQLNQTRSQDAFGVVLPTAEANLTGGGQDSYPFFNPGLSSDQRVQTLLKILEGLSLSPSG